MPGEGPLTGGGGVSNFKELSDTPADYTGQSGKTATVKATEDGIEFTTPAGGGDMLVATYDPASKATQLLATSDVVTTIADPGLDTKVPSEQGVREALNAIDQKKIKSTYFETITSGTTSGTATKPASAGADVDFIMDEWGTATDALVSTIENGRPTFKSPVNAAGSTITTTFDTAGAFIFSDTPSPAADHALIYVYTCYIKNFDVAEALWETELLDYVADHASTHTDGSDDIQAATNAQKGLATAAHITAIEANTTHISSDGSDHTFIDQDVTIGSSPTLDGANITNIDADTLIADVKEANVSAVKKGQACAIVGSSGSKFEVQLADCNNVNLLKLLGLSDADVNQNEEGTVVHKGLLPIVDTQTSNTDVNPNAETWTAGDLLYVSTTPGGLTNVQPAGRCIIVGYSLKGNSASDTILVVTKTDILCTCAAPGEDICHVMGDSDGVNKVTFKDYAGSEVTAIDSNGNLTLIGTVDGRDIEFDVTNSGTFIGYHAGDSNTTGAFNSFIGHDAGTANTSGLRNTSLGYGALQDNTEGSYNTGVGADSLFGLGGSYNVGVGANSIRNTTASNNTGIGYNAGYGLLGGANNVLVGYQAGDNLTTGGSNIVIGYNVDANAVDSENILNIGNLLFGTSIDGTGLNISTGNIGIATKSPGGKLCVNGGVTVGSDTDAGDNNLRVEGNIIVEGTVDGRDIAADGTKLDGAAPRYIQIRLLDKDTSHSVEDGIGGDFRLKIAMTVLDVGMYFDTPGTDSVTTMQIKEGGVNILSTAITVDAGEKTSETAAVPPVISDSAIAADAIITFNLSGIASGTAGKGLVVWLEATTP